jgi:thymidylate synthase (FAD)
MMENMISNAFTFEILQTEEELQHQLRIVERMGRLCYDSNSANNNESAESFTRRLITQTHTSVIEHSLLSVILTGVSRGLTHELVRHRHTANSPAISQQSTRYVNCGDFDLIVPSHLAASEKAADYSKRLVDIYADLIADGWKKEDARQFLPTGVATKIGLSANFSEWRYIMMRRVAGDAHWEIRTLMSSLLIDLKRLLPAVFFDFVADGIDPETGVTVWRFIGTVPLDRELVNKYRESLRILCETPSVLDCRKTLEGVLVEHEDECEFFPKGMTAEAGYTNKFIWNKLQRLHELIAKKGKETT